MASTSLPVMFLDALAATTGGVLENSAITVFRPGVWQYECMEVWANEILNDAPTLDMSLSRSSSENMLDERALIMISV